MSLTRRHAEARALSYQDVWSGGDPVRGHREMTENSALQLSAVYGAVRILANSVASLPMQTYRRDGERRRRIDDPPLVANPGARGVRWNWLHSCVASLALRGNAYGLIVARDRNAVPTQIEWLHPDDVAVVDNFALGTPQWRVYGRELDPRDLLHIPYFTLPGQVLGLSVIGAFRTMFQSGLDAVSFGADWFHNGAVPSAVLETDQPVDQPTAQRIKRKFVSAADGREPVVLGAGVKYKPITVPPEESQFLQTIKATANQVAAIFGVRPEKIGGETGSSLTYANTEQLADDEVKFTLMPYLTLIEESVGALLPRAQFVKFQTDALVRPDLKTRVEATLLQVQGGLLTNAEARALDDREPLDTAAPDLKALAVTVKTLVDAGYAPDQVLQVLGLPALPTAPQNGAAQ